MQVVQVFFLVRRMWVTGVEHFFLKLTEISLRVGCWQGQKPGLGTNISFDSALCKVPVH